MDTDRIHALAPRTPAHPVRPPTRRLPATVADPVDAVPPHGEPVLARDGRPLRLRPIHRSDVAMLQRAFRRMTPEQVRLRVFHALNDLPDPIARHLCKVDPDVAAAFVVTDDDGAEIRGEARVHFDAVTEGAEFAIAIHPSFTGNGVGWALMTRLIETSRARGMREIWGHVLAENGGMLDLAARLGFSREGVLGEPGVLLVRMPLAPSA